LPAEGTVGVTTRSGSRSAQWAAPTNASVAAADQIRDAILHGRIEPGRRLKEHEIAVELGVSRTPVREALLILESEGLLESERKRGMSVRTYDADDLDGMYRFRALLEGYAAREAAARVTADLIAKLRESCERFGELRRSDDILGLAQENTFFHTTIIDANRSERLTRIIKSVHVVPLVYRSYAWYSEEERLVIQHYHTQLVNALEARDGERAEGIMREHVLHARDLLVRRWRALAPGRAGEGILT